MTNNQIPSHLRIALESINVFADDGKIDVVELNRLLSIAEEDGKIDCEEARVLSNILQRATTSDLEPETIKRIQAISEIIMKSNH